MPSFQNPKPEQLINVSSSLPPDPDDWVLDSFAGSGTTGAVAHKMGRRWIMVELGEHCQTHIIPRLKKVIDGEDPGGITEAVGWKGGGGLPVLPTRAVSAGEGQVGQLGHQLVVQRRHAGRGDLQAGGFIYEPSDTIYWKHGRSSETDFIYVTTQMLNQDKLTKLGERGRERRSLLSSAGLPW